MADPASTAEAGGDDEKAISSRNKVEEFLKGLPENVRARVERLRSLQSRIDEAMKEWDLQDAAMAAMAAREEASAGGGAATTATTSVVADPSQAESRFNEPNNESGHEICPDSWVDYEKVIADLYRERLELITSAGGGGGGAAAAAAAAAAEGDDDEGSSPGRDDAFPPFWSTAMAKSVLGQFISMRDGEVMKHLRDIRCKLIDDVDIDLDDKSHGGKEDAAPPASSSSSSSSLSRRDQDEDERRRHHRRRPRRPHSFTLEFEFDANDYFTNEVLSKSFYANGEDDDPKVWKIEGSKIDWKQGHNLCLSKRSKSRIRAIWKSVWKDGDEENPNCAGESRPITGPGADEPGSTTAEPPGAEPGRTAELGADEPGSTNAGPGAEPGPTNGPGAPESGADPCLENSDSFKSFWTASFGDCGAVDEDDWNSFFDFFGPIFIDFPSRPMLFPPALPPTGSTTTTGNSDHGRSTSIATGSRTPHPNSFVTTITYTGTTVTLRSVMDHKTESEGGDSRDGEILLKESGSSSSDDCKVFQVRGVTYELDQLRDRLLDHYVIGLMIKDNLIPRAVHWYTGEAVEDDGDDDEEDEEEEQGGEEDGGRRDDKGRSDE